MQLFGDYTLEGVGTCGTPVTGVFTIYDKSINATVTHQLNCRSFNVSGSIESYLVTERLWLQKYYPASGQWGHPTTGDLYTEGTIIGSLTGLLFNGSGNYNSGLDTLNFNLQNVVSTGQFRVVVQYVIPKNGTTGNVYCRDVLETFSVPANGISLNNYYVVGCTNGNFELVFDAKWVATLTYKIIALDGAPYVVYNANNPVFKDLASGTYGVEISDACGNAVTFDRHYPAKCVSFKN